MSPSRRSAAAAFLRRVREAEERRQREPVEWLMVTEAWAIELAAGRVPEEVRQMARLATDAGFDQMLRENAAKRQA